MRRRVLKGALALGAAAAIASLAVAQQLPTVTHDFKDAPPGTYQIDPKHTGVIARVPHLGFSFSIFRFTGVTGALQWNPADPAADRLEASVDTRSIVTGPVEGFAGELQGEKFLNAVKFPTASFVARSFRPEGPARGVIEGDLTLMGVTRPLRLQADLVGSGKGFRGPVIGASAHGLVDPKDYGLPAFITGPIEIHIDTEFDKQP